MNEIDPRWLVALGAALMLFGFGVVFAMVVQWLASSLALNFAAYGASFVGLVVGLVGLIGYRKRGN